MATPTSDVLARDSCMRPSVTTTAVTTTKDGSGCALMSMPLANPRVTAPFSAPEAAWAPGHRGIDLTAGEGDLIYSPDDGVVSFVGRVAGKNVLSVRHALVVSSFEPATSDLKVGDVVARGQRIGVVSVGSDHCDGRCLHWGLRARDGNRYVDPRIWTETGPIVLKPVISANQGG